MLIFATAVKQALSLSRACLTQEVPNYKNCSLYQIVRYRKPRWVPKSKSKEFYVRERTPIDPEEYIELKWRYAHYRTITKAIRSYLTPLASDSKKTSRVQIEAATISKDMNIMIEENKKWNERVAIIREEHMKKVEAKLAEKLNRVVVKETERKLKLLEDAEKQVKEEIEKSKSFIPLEKLDDAIEEVLNQRTDYNFAVEQDGKVVTETQFTMPSSPSEMSPVSPSRHISKS